MRDIRLMEEGFEPAEMLRAFSAANRGLGGLCSFVGEVRGENDVEALELTHYAPLTLAGMEELADRSFDRFELLGLMMLHRIGQLQPGEPIVCVAAASIHRRDAINAVDFCMDHLKSAAWFWKREKRKDGWHWIEPRAQDYSDKDRW